MKVKDFRSKFQVYVYDYKVESSTHLAKILAEAGFAAQVFVERADLAESIQRDAPHIVLLCGELLTQGLISSIEEIRGLSQEIIIMVCLELNSEVSPQFVQKADAVLHYRKGLEFEVIKSLDLAVKSLYYKFQGETLMRSAQELKIKLETQKLKSEVESQVSLKSLNQVSNWYRSMANANQYEEAIDILLDSIQQFAGSLGSVFLRYVPAHMSLLPTQHRAIKTEIPRGIGLDLRGETDSGFEVLKTNPLQYQKLQQFVAFAFHQAGFYAVPIVIKGDLKGVLVVLSQELDGETKEFIDLQILGFQMTYKNLYLEKRLHNVEILDDVTSTLKRPHLQERILQEVSRARRTGLPVTFLLLSIDHYQDILQQNGRSRTEHLLRALSTVLRKTSRINDIVGRCGISEFGILLPHTGLRGAIVKAERLRRIIEATTLVKGGGADLKITVSIGVCEYPSHCLDADDLFNNADFALQEVRSTGFNKVCVAVPPENFVPDVIPFPIRAEKSQS